MNNKYKQVCQILNEMPFGKALVHGTKTIVKRMPLGLKAFTVAPIPVVPNTVMGIGAQLATDKRSRDISRVIARRGYRSAGSSLKKLLHKSPSNATVTSVAKNPIQRIRLVPT